MATLPPLLAGSIVLCLIALAATAYQYWNRKPEQAQFAVRRVFTFLFRLLSWAGMMVCIPGMTFLHALAAMVHVTIRCWKGEPYKVVFDLQ